MAEEPLILYTDGACRGNPGPSAVGVTVRSAGGLEIDHLSERTADGTNNEAEYRAVIRGLELAAKHAKGATLVEVRTDSQLLVRQLNGEYKVRKPELVALLGEVLRAQRPFREVRFAWVPREDPGSARADALANEALETTGHPKAPKPGGAPR